MKQRTQYKDQNVTLKIKIQNKIIGVNCNMHGFEKTKEHEKTVVLGKQCMENCKCFPHFSSFCSILANCRFRTPNALSFLA